jgi:hypothetical protein
MERCRIPACPAQLFFCLSHSMAKIGLKSMAMSVTEASILSPAAPHDGLIV